MAPETTQPPFTDPRIGTLLADTYRLLEPIGEGGMASVYRAAHTRIDRQFAVKILQIKAAQYPNVLERFEREAKIGSQLGHDNIVQVIDFNRTAQGEPYLVMDLLSGRDLAKLLHLEQRVPLEWALAVIRQVAAALGAAHSHGVIHRDLKPENIFLCGDAQRQVRAKVMDFGLAKVLSAQSGLTHPSAVFGTPWYMSPEQALGHAQESDQRTDIYAVGVILYRLLSGRLPFDGPNIHSVLYKIVHEEPTPLQLLQPALPASLPGVVARAMHKQAEARYASAADLMAELQAAMGPRWSLVLAWGQPPEERVVEVSWTASAAMGPAEPDPAVAAQETLLSMPSDLPSVATGPQQRSVEASDIQLESVRSRRWLFLVAVLLAGGLAAAAFAWLRPERGQRQDQARAPGSGLAIAPASRPSSSGGRSAPSVEARPPISEPKAKVIDAGSPKIRVAPRPRLSALTIIAHFEGRTIAADVFLDDKKVDQAPVVLSGLKPGRRCVIRLQAPGFREERAVVILRPGKANKLSVKLRR